MRLPPAADVARYADHFAHGWDEERQRRLLRMTRMGLVSCTLAPMEPTVLPAWNEPETVLQRVTGRQEVAQAVPWIQLNREQEAFQAAKMAVYAAMVDVMDREIGRVVDRLRSMGVLENTLIVFMSDNGASAEQILRGDGHKAEAPVGSAETFYFQHLDNQGLRQGDWKIVASGIDAPWELYRVASDRGECHNLADREPERVQATAELWHRYHTQFSEQSQR